jgi:hypothetical protein
MNLLTLAARSLCTFEMLAMIPSATSLSNLSLASYHCQLVVLLLSLVWP